MEEINIEETLPIQPTGSQSGIWPPPPDNPDAPILTIPFKNNFKVQKGSAADFRTGTISIVNGGITIIAKATLRYEIRTPIMIVLWIFWPLSLAAYLIVEAAKFDQYAQIPWSAVRSIVLSPKKRQACIVYDYPNYSGVVKTFSLGFDLKDNYNTFAEVVQSMVPDRATEGKLRTWNSPPGLAFFVLFLVYLACSFVAGLLKH